MNITTQSLLMRFQNRITMGIKDWFKKKPDVEPDEVVEKSEPITLPELDREELLDETLSVIMSDETMPVPEIIVDAVPEYDSGEVEVESLLDESMESNYELNTVDETDFEDMLENARVIGDIPEEVTFEKGE